MRPWFYDIFDIPTCRVRNNTFIVTYLSFCKFISFYTEVTDTSIKRISMIYEGDMKPMMVSFVEITNKRPGGKCKARLSHRTESRDHPVIHI